MNELHPLLRRQLRKLNLDRQTAPSAEAWADLLDRLNQSYFTHDQDRALLERSLALSSQEMTALYENLRRSTETQLAMERDKLQSVVTSVADGLCLLDDEGKLVYMNPAAEKIVLWSSDYLIGKPFLDIVLCSAEGTSPIWQKAVIHRHPYQEVDAIFRNRLGTLFPVEYNLNPTIGSQSGMVLTFRDITKRKESEHALRESEEKSMLLHTISSTPSRKIEEQLQNALAVATKALDMELGIISKIQGDIYTVIDFYGTIFPLAQGQKFNLGETYCSVVVEKNQTIAVNHVGQSFYQCHPCYQTFGLEAYIGSPIYVHGRFFGTLNFSRPNYRPTPFSNSDKNFVNLLAQWVSSVIERRLADERLQAYSANLEQSNRELQDFAYVASHDLQEPLRKIQAFGSRVEKMYGDKLEDRGRDYLQRMSNAAARMQSLINDLLAFSRVTTRPEPFQSINLNRIVQEVLGDLEVRIEQSSAEVIVGPLPIIDGDPTQLRMLFQNLLGNALKFSRPGVSPIIQVNCQLLERIFEEDGLPNIKEGYQQLTIQDNGIGFDPKYVDRIFNIFQRLHGRGEYEGTGVGLAICRKIADRHHGTITATSTPQEGATFIITLPTKQAIYLEESVYES